MNPLLLGWLLYPLLVCAVVLGGLHVAGRRAGLTASAAMLPACVLFGWLGLVSALSLGGVLGDFSRVPPPLFAMVMGGTVLGVTVLGRTARVRAALGAMPSWWLVAFQSFRVIIELGIWALFLEGLMPKQMTFEGRNLDVLVGVTAPVMAWLLATRRAGPFAMLGWQLFGISLLVNVIGVAITSAPGPLHLDWPGEPLTVVGQLPYVMLPTVMVPLAMMGHVAGVRAALRELGGRRGLNEDLVERQ